MKSWICRKYFYMRARYTRSVYNFYNEGFKDQKNFIIDTYVDTYMYN